MAEARLFRLLHPALLIALVALASVAVRGSPGAISDRQLSAQPAVVVGWPPSQGLVVSEVVTGAASASDELIEIYNANTAAADLGGLEIVYVTASGSTVTRKQTWTALIVASRRHLLIANSAGKWAASADGLYTGGLAASGGSIVLRVVGGNVIDSLSWGDAASSFVEGAAGPAPVAGSSLERKPGGQAGNSVDSNDNLADTRIETNPTAQSLVSEPVPAPTPTPGATPSPTPPTSPSPPPTSTPSPTDPTETPSATEPCTPEPSVTPSPGPSATPRPTPTPTPSTSPTTTPTETFTPSPEPTPTLSPGPTETPEFPGDTPSPPSSPTPAATPTPTGSPTSFATLSATPTETVPPTPAATPSPNLNAVRQLPVGTRVQVAGRLTTPTRLLSGGNLAFIEDATGGIALQLDSADWAALPAGADVYAEGTLESRDALLAVVLDDPTDISQTGSGPLPDPLTVATGLACEPFEARLIAVEGRVASLPASVGGGFGSVIDDGTGPLSVVVGNATGIGPEEMLLGSRLRLTGILTQRDPAGDGAGYELLLRSIDDVVLISPPPTPTPTPTPSPTATATPSATASPTVSPAPTASPSPTATPTPAPTSTASPSPTPSPISISVARSRSIGAVVRVRGVVTVGPGWILGDSTIALQDATAGIFVRLPDPSVAGIVPGRAVEVEGALAAPYGNLEVRPAAAGVHVLEMGSQLSARTLAIAELGEGTEGLLARTSVTVTSIESSTSGSLTLIVEDASGEGRMFMYAPLGLTHDDFSVGERIAAIGLVGDRLGLYRLWPRNQSDIAIVPVDPTPTPTSNATPTPTAHATPTPSAHPTPTPTGHGTPSPSPTASPGSGSVIGIADAIRRQGQQVTIEGTVTTRPGLLDTDGARVTVQDSTAAILVRLPSDTTAQPGQRLRVSGAIGTYYGAPQLTATTASRTGDGSVSPISVRSAPISAGLEWRLVTVTGTIESVHRDGESWRAEITLSGGTVPIVGISRSGIESTALVAARTATVTGVVKRAYPTASDQRFAIVPRTAADIRLGSAPGNGSPAPSSAPGSGSPTQHPTPGATWGTSNSNGPSAAPGATHSGIPGNGSGVPTVWNGKTVVALADLAAHETETVAVGGVVERIDGARIVINDGTAVATVRFHGDALPMVGLFGQGDVLNALGTVERVATGGLELAVSDPATVARLAPIGVSPGETANAGPETTPLGQANQQVSATGLASTATMAAILLALSIAVAAAAILAVPSTRNALREHAHRLSDGFRRWIVQLRSG